jgi:hypothetical protein
MEEIRCLSATGQLGYGIVKDSFYRGLEKGPHFIGADMGSIDPGPYSLGSGSSMKSYSNIKSDLELLIVAGKKLGIPVLMGSAGTAGGDVHLSYYLDIVQEIAKENSLDLTIAAIYSEVSKGMVKEKLMQKKIKVHSPNVPELTEEGIDQSIRIVAQAGVEPYMEALNEEVDVVIAGRSSDTSIFASYPIYKGYDKGLAIHMAKIVECASLCAEPGGRDAIMAYLRDDHFVLESMNPQRHCTPLSVAAHSLYEECNPYEVVEPGGRLVLDDVLYEAVNEHVTMVSGSKWIPAEKYTVKLEGARLDGMRSLAIGVIMDPYMIKEIDYVMREVESIVRRVEDRHDYQLQFRIYGRDSSEMTVFIISMAESQELAHAVCGIAKQNFLHVSYPGIKATSGNMAIPFSPDVIDIGASYSFNIYHIMEVETPLECFKINYLDVKGGSHV